MDPEKLNWKVDRTGWEDGPWNHEPDRIDFHHTGFACLMLRSRNGNWCGYVGVPPSHSAYGRDYNEVDVECHGGLTYGEKCDGQHICHVPAEGEEDDLFWLGFDCAHCWDVLPGREARERQLGLSPFPFRGEDFSEYRDAQYVRNQVERLAEQLVERADARALSDGC